MNIRSITAEQGLQLERGSALVCIPVAGPPDDVTAGRARESTLSVIEHSDPSTTVLIAGAEVEEIVKGLSGESAGREVLTLALGPEVTEAEALGAAARAGGASDLVLLTPGVQVRAGWLERLQAAAASDSTVASATPLSVGHDALALLDGDEQRAAGEVAELADRVSAIAPRLRPRIASIGPGCAYIRRATLELVGPLDQTLPLQAALADLALRAIAAGLVHVAADDVLVAGPGGAGTEPEQRGAPASPSLAGRVQETIINDEHGRLHRSMSVRRMALSRVSVTIDGRSLVSAVGGTQTYVLDLILALADQPRVALRVLVPPDLSPRAADALARFPDVELLTYEQALDRPPLTAVVHRPQPIFTSDDLTLLRLVGERVVIGQQDLIAFHNYSYHRDVEAWRSYRRTTRLSLAAVDQVIFFSEHARADALAEDLLPESRTHVVGVGGEALEPEGSPGEPPDGLAADEPFLLCLGADYAHKNRPFAIELLGSLRELGWDGRLVLAGSHVSFGSSRERERELLLERPDIAGAVLDLGPVAEPVKQWLFRHARALVYPTIYEGLGLLPLEAARVDVPCVFAAQASLSELAGKAATLVPWDPGASAVAVLGLLSDGPARERHLAELRSLTVPAWSEVASRLVAVYEQAVAAPPSEAAPRSWQELDREVYIEGLERRADHLTGVAQEYQDAYHALERRLGPGLPLIDSDGLLSHAQQRGLMRIAGRRGLRALLAPLRLLGRGAEGSEPPG
jgi:glycosyltransferase involved in cell wall biosynthesis